MKIRLEAPADYFEVENLTREAFWNVYRPGSDEHWVLHQLRKKAAFIKELAYIAIEDEKIVGNITYSRIFSVNHKRMSEEIISFGPLSVHPGYQKQGIGKRLVIDSLKQAQELGYKAVMITGDSGYYSQFGFRSASNYGVFLPGMSESEEYEFFMVKELEEGYLKNHSGVYDFDSCFSVNSDELDEFEKQFPVKVKREPRSTDIS